MRFSAWNLYVALVGYERMCVEGSQLSERTVRLETLVSGELVGSGVKRKAGIGVMVCVSVPRSRGGKDGTRERKRPGRAVGIPRRRHSGRRLLRGRARHLARARRPRPRRAAGHVEPRAA